MQTRVLDQVESCPRLGYTNLPNPCEGIQGYSLKKRTVYISDAVYKAVWANGSAPLRDAMDLAHLTGQRPADALKMTEHDIIEGHLIVTQEKTKQPLRITAPALRSQFDKARDAASKSEPKLAQDIKKFRFYDLRAKAADDTADGRGQEAAVICWVMRVSRQRSGTIYGGAR